MAAYSARHLLDHGDIRVENVSKPTYHDRDVRQDAAVRLVKTFQRQGTALQEDTLVQTLNSQPTYISQSLKSSVIDASRKRKHIVSLDAWYDTAVKIADPAAQDALDAVESTAKDELDAFASSATEAEMEALNLMRHCQQLLANGQQLPNSVRSKLKRLRRETGLALDVSLL